MALDKAQSGLGSQAKPVLRPRRFDLHDARVWTAFLRECSWKCKSRRAVSATTACCWPS